LLLRALELSASLCLLHQLSASHGTESGPYFCYVVYRYLEISSKPSSYFARKVKIIAEILSKCWHIYYCEILTDENREYKSPFCRADG
jgi:hypothetical protein